MYITFELNTYGTKYDMDVHYIKQLSIIFSINAVYNRFQFRSRQRDRSITIKCKLTIS